MKRALYTPQWMLAYMRELTADNDREMVRFLLAECRRIRRSFRRMAPR